MRRNSPSWGEGKSQEGSRPPRREFAERPAPERVPTAAEMDSQWRTKMKPDAPAAPPPQAAQSPALSNRELSNPPSPAAPPSAPTTRPKLNLAKRTVSEAQPDATSTPASDSKSSPFGAAKPIDTAAKEKELEEKREVVAREKKDADEKAKVEKKAADDKAREEKKAAKEKEEVAKPQSQQPRERTNGQRAEKGEKPEKGNGSPPAPPGKQYEILRRGAGDDASAASVEPEEAGEGSQNGLPVGDKETKPKEIVRDIGSTNGETKQDPPVSTANELAEDGWETVPTKKGRKGGPAGGRALAS